MGFSMSLILYLDFLKIDCDQFSCVGFLIFIIPIFLTGLSIMIIVAIVNIVVAINKHFKQRETEENI
jgi:hypothetical protein